MAHRILGEWRAASTDGRVAATATADSPGGGLPARAKPVFFAVIAVAAALSVAALIALDPASAPWSQFALLALSAALAQLFVVRTGRNQSYHTAIPFLVAAALVLPPGLVVLVVLAQHAPDWLKSRYPWYIQTFNIANYVLDALAAWATMYGLQHSGLEGDAQRTIVAIAAAVVFVVCNHCVLGLMLYVARGRTLRESGLFSLEALGTDLILAGLGPVLVAVWQSDPVLVVAALAPLVLVHRSFVVVQLREDRKREEEVRAAETKYRLLVEQLPLVTYVLAPDHTVGYVSPQIEAVLGRTVQDAIEKDEFWLETLHPDDRERIPAAWHECVTHGLPFQGEYRMLAADGSTVWIQDEAVAAREGDETLYFQGYLLDITERKQAEERLANLSRQNDLLLRSVGEGILGLDRQGRVSFANPAAARFTGLAPEALLGLDLHDAVIHSGADEPPCSSDECDFVATLGDGIERHFEAELTRPTDCATFVVECTTSPLVENGALVGAAVVVRDISEQRALEDQLRQAHKLEAVGKLAGGVAHDFNNLLTVITGNCELALVGLDDQSVRDSVGEIRRAADRAVALTQQLLAFSRKQVLQPRVLNLNGVVADVESLLRRLISEDIVLTHELDPSAAPVRADRNQLEQVLLNLAVNARDAMSEGGRLTIQTANTALAAEAARALGVSPGRYVELSVSDTGHGMDAETRKRVFEPFFTTKEQGKGTGLGLATAYGIVAQSGGAMSVESTPGSGSTFTVYLPSSDHAPSEEPTVVGRPAEPAPVKGTVLLVEDEEIVRKLTRKMLQLSGLSVLEASDPHEAVSICAAHEGVIDVLLTDVVMPNMSGYALAERVRLIRPQIDVVFTSGYSEDVVASRGMLEPGMTFLPKPFTSEKLVSTIHGALNGKGAACV
jgi:two-component system, cell cycle sensor histidine kinase and response regulator CckA